MIKTWLARWGVKTVCLPWATTTSQFTVYETFVWIKKKRSKRLSKVSHTLSNYDRSLLTIKICKGAVRRNLCIQVKLITSSSRAIHKTSLSKSFSRLPIAWKATAKQIKIKQTIRIQITSFQTLQLETPSTKTLMSFQTNSVGFSRLPYRITSTK